MPPAHIIFEGKVIAETRWPWFHKMFGGWKGWRQIIQEGMRKHSGNDHVHVLGRFFGRLIFLDADTSSCWLKPRKEGTQDGYAIRVGWLYWAIGYTKRDWYPNPRNLMPGFKDLPYHNEALEASYYLHGQQVKP